MPTGVEYGGGPPPRVNGNLVRIVALALVAELGFTSSAIVWLSLNGQPVPASLAALAGLAGGALAAWLARP